MHLVQPIIKTRLHIYIAWKLFKSQTNRTTIMCLAVCKFKAVAGDYPSNLSGNNREVSVGIKIGACAIVSPGWRVEIPSISRISKLSLRWEGRARSSNLFSKVFLHRPYSGLSSPPREQGEGRGGERTTGRRRWRWGDLSFKGRFFQAANPADCVRRSPIPSRNPRSWRSGRACRRDKGTRDEEEEVAGGEGRRRRRRRRRRGGGG